MASLSESDFDAIVASEAPQGVVDGIFFYTHLVAAIIEGRTSILMKDGGLDTDPVVIAAEDQTQRIQGMGADTVALVVGVTCNKNAVTFEQLNIVAALSIAQSNADDDILREVLFSEAGQVTIGEDTTSTDNTNVENCRSIASSVTPIVVRAVSTGVSIRGFRARVPTGASLIEITGGFGSARNMEISGLLLVNGLGLSDYVIKSSGLTNPQGGVEINGSYLFDIGDKGGADLLVLRGTIVGGQWVMGEPLTAGRRLLKVTGPTGANIDFKVIGLKLIAADAADILFECASADADAQGLILIGVTARTGIILGSQDAQWSDCDFAGCTIDYQSKTGIHHIGGDCTGATVLNEPADLYRRGVKGLPDRGFSTDDAPQARVFNNANIAIVTATLTALTFNSEDWDNDTIHSTSSNTERLTATTAGKCRVRGRVLWDNSILGTYRLVQIRKNGAGNPLDLEIAAPANFGFIGITQMVEAEVNLAAGDYVTLEVQHDAGVNINVLSAGDYSPYFAMQRIGV